MMFKGENIEHRFNDHLLLRASAYFVPPGSARKFHSVRRPNPTSEVLIAFPDETRGGLAESDLHLDSRFSHCRWF